MSRAQGTFTFYVGQDEVVWDWLESTPSCSKKLRALIHEAAGRGAEPTTGALLAILREIKMLLGEVIGLLRERDDGC